MSHTTDVFEELVKDLSWYHPHCTRHIAESILIQNGQEGSYLLRPSSLPGELAVSVRCKDSVKHFNVVWNGHHYVFGLITFVDREEFVGHFHKQPYIAGESGIITWLKHPYPRSVTEPKTYDVVRVHGQYGKTRGISPVTLGISSKEGFLTKLGGFVKNWKLRWFVLMRNDLSYFKLKSDSTPLRKLDLSQCLGCSGDETLGKQHCFSLEFSWRTFYLICETQAEMEEWMNIIKWKLKNSKGSERSEGSEAIEISNTK